MTHFSAPAANANHAAMHIRPASSADAPALWPIIEPVIRAGETYALDRNLSRAELSRIGWEQIRKSSLPSKPAPFSAPIICVPIRLAVAGMSATVDTLQRLMRQVEASRAACANTQW